MSEQSKLEKVACEIANASFHCLNDYYYLGLVAGIKAVEEGLCRDDLTYTSDEIKDLINTMIESNKNIKEMVLRLEENNNE